MLAGDLLIQQKLTPLWGIYVYRWKIAITPHEQCNSSKNGQTTDPVEEKLLSKLHPCLDSNDWNWVNVAITDYFYSEVVLTND